MSQKKFYVVMVIASSILGKDGRPPRVRYSPPDAKKVTVAKNVPLFVYRNPVLNKWFVNEVSTGMEVSDGNTEQEAVDEAAKFFQEANEERFFLQMKAIGRHYVWPIITFDAAMAHCRAGVEARNGKVLAAAKK